MVSGAWVGRMGERELRRRPGSGRAGRPVRPIRVKCRSKADLTCIKSNSGGAALQRPAGLVVVEEQQQRPRFHVCKLIRTFVKAKAIHSQANGTGGRGGGGDRVGFDKRARTHGREWRLALVVPEASWLVVGWRGVRAGSRGLVGWWPAVMARSIDTLIDRTI